MGRKFHFFNTTCFVKAVYLFGWLLSISGYHFNLYYNALRQSELLYGSASLYCTRVSLSLSLSYTSLTVAERKKTFIIYI